MILAAPRLQVMSKLTAMCTGRIAYAHNARTTSVRRASRAWLAFQGTRCATGAARAGGIARRGRAISRFRLLKTPARLGTDRESSAMHAQFALLDGELMKGQSRIARKRARRRQKMVRLTVYLGLVLIVLGLAGYLLGSAFKRPDLTPMAGTVIDVAADMAGFDKDTIRVKANEAVTVRLTSLDNSHHTDGGGKHQWAVDELGVSIIAPPEGSNFATFTPQQLGSYTFYCDICCGGRANPTMQGTLIVEA